MPDPTARAALIEAMAKAHYEAVNIRIHGNVYPKWDDDPRREWLRSDMSAALAAIEAHGGGCVVVPREATGDMRCAGGIARTHMFMDPNTDATWAAMLDRSPYAPPKQGEPEA